MGSDKMRAVVCRGRGYYEKYVTAVLCSVCETAAASQQTDDGHQQPADVSSHRQSSWEHICVCDKIGLLSPPPLLLLPLRQSENGSSKVYVASSICSR